MATMTTTYNATDRLHIGNEWIGHSGLNWYDNTARMHDPVLMRFTSPDPLYTDYPSTSPWAHCAANPLNAIDPTGMDNWQLDDRGYFSLVEQTEDDFDVILGREGASIQVEKTFLKSIEDFNRKYKNNIYNVSLFELDQNGSQVFEFLADNSTVEWSRMKLSTGLNYIGTSHDPDHDGSIDVLSQVHPDEFKMINIFDHNHTNGGSYPSQKDINFANRLYENDNTVLCRVYTTPELYYYDNLHKPLYLHYRVYYPNIIMK